MKNVTPESLIGFARTIAGSELTTVTGKRFRIAVDGNKLVYTPASTGKPRNQTFGTLKRICTEFAESGSLLTSDYTKITANSSYALSLIREFVK